MGDPEETGEHTGEHRLDVFEAEPTQLHGTTEAVSPSAPPPMPEPVPGRSRWDEELELLCKEASALGERDPTRGALMWGAVATLAAATGRADRAAQALQSAARLSRERWIAMLHRRRALGARDAASAITFAREELLQVGDPRERVALLIEIAAIEELINKARPAARAALLEARELDPANATVMEALCELYLVDKDWEPLVGVLAAMADATVDVQYRSMLRLNAGLVHDIHLGRRNAARAAYKLALADDGNNLAAVLCLESLSLLDGDWLELGRTLLQEAKLVTDARTVRRLRERAGDVFWEKLQDGDAAATAYQHASRAMPAELSPLMKLAAVLESLGRWRELIDVYEKALPLTQDPDARADLHFRIAEVQRSKLDHADAAETAYLSALDAAPLHLPTLQALAAFYRAGERWAELAQMELREAEKINDRVRRAERLFEIAELIEHRLGDENEAIRLLERAYELQPGCRAAFDGLDRLYRRHERWAELVRLYEDHARAIHDPALYRFLRQEAGRLWRERVPNGENAVAALCDAHLTRETDIGPILLEAQVLEATERWEALVPVLEEIVGIMKEPLDQIGTLHRLARLLDVKLGRPERALAVHERVLQIDKVNEMSLRACARLHHQAGRWDGLNASWRLQLAHCQNADERAAIHYHIGRVLERELGRRDDAIAAYERALDESRKYLPAMTALERILRRDQLWPQLLVALDKLAAAESDPASRAYDHHSMGQICELHLRDLKSALEHYRKATELKPDYEPAAIALVHVAEGLGDWNTVNDQLTDLLEGATAADARMILLTRIGLVCEYRLADPKRAAQSYTEVIDTNKLGRTLMLADLHARYAGGGAGETVASLVRLGAHSSDIRLAHAYRALAALRDELSSERPNDTLFLDAAKLEQGDPMVADGVIRALERWHADEQPPRTLTEALVERARVCSNAPAKTPLLLEAAFLADVASHAEEAGKLYEETGRAMPGFVPVLRGRRRLAVSLADWPGAMDLYAREAEAAADRHNRAVALIAAGEIALSRLSDREVALRHYRRLLELDPTHEEAFVRARRLLEDLGDAAGLLNLVVARAAASVVPRERAQLLLLQAQLQRDRLNDPRGAVAALKQAIALQPDTLEPYLMLAPLEESQRWWQDAADCYRRIGEKTAGTDVSRTARLKEAEIRERELGDREAARQILEELVVDPDDREAARHMARLCERMGDYGRSRQLYRQIATGAGPLEKADALVALSRVPSASVQDAAGTRALDEAFALAIEQPEVVDLLLDRYGSANDWSGFARAAERAVARGFNGRGLLPLLMALGQVYRDRLQKPELAVNHLTTAAQLAPRDASLATRLGALQLADGRLDRAMPEFQRAISVDPFFGEALRGLAQVLQTGRSPEGGRMLEVIADFVDGRPAQLAPSRPARIKGGVAELQSLAPAVKDANASVVAALLQQLEVHAPALIIELTGRTARGEDLPATHPIHQRIQALASAFGMSCPRIIVDADGSRAQLGADGQIVLTVGRKLLASGAQPWLAYEVARLMFFLAGGNVLTAAFGASELSGVLIALGLEREASEQLADVHQRVSRALPRRLRKDLERAIPSVNAVGKAVAELHGARHVAADRAALLIARDPLTALAWAAGSGELATIRTNTRAAEVVRWLASDPSWRVHSALVTE